MMRWVLGLAGALVLAAVAVAGVVFYRTSSFGAATLATETMTLPEPPAVDVQLAAEALGEAIRFQTVSTGAGPLSAEAAAPWLALHAFLEARYPDAFSRMTKELAAEHTLLLTWPGTDASLQPIVLMAHQDVVPVNPGTDADWTHGPFGGVVADGYVWGRGAMDDKGSLIALMESAEALTKSGWAPKRSIIFLFGHDEEVGGTGAQAAFALLKSRGVDPAMVLDEGFAAIENFPLTGKPAALIGIAEKGYLSLRITATTAGGHSSQPPRDSGAIRIARAILALEENQMPDHLDAPSMAGMVEAVAADMPFMAKMAFANQWLFRTMILEQLKDGAAGAMVRTTTAPTMLNGSIKDNVLPQRASAVVNFRIHPSDSVASVKDHVARATSGIEGLTIEEYEDGIGSEPSPVSSTSSEAWKVLSAVASDVGGGAPVAPALVIGATDARFASAVSEDAIYRFAPAVYSDEDLTVFHGTNEKLSVANLGRMIRGYSQIMLAMCG